MAPFAGLSPAQLVHMLADPMVERRLPLSMGGPAGPTAQVGLLGGRWCLYRMAGDDAAWMAFIARRQQSGESILPEHSMQFLVPGEILVAAESRAELRAALERVELAFDDHYRLQLRPRDQPAP